MITGLCHCGAVRIEVPRRPRALKVRIRLLDGADTWKYLD
jgi:hypothetical protein